jgi:hypothetical protein
MDGESKDAAHETIPMHTQKSAASTSVSPAPASPPPPKLSEAESLKLPVQKGAASTNNPVPAPSPALSGQARITAETAKPPQLVPLLKLPGPGIAPVPKDWQDFCHAASATACIYLPANASFTLPVVVGGYAGKVVETEDVDPLIMDQSVCNYDGGFLDGTDGCVFWYFPAYYGDFKPTGALSTTASCDSPGTYQVDPKGAVELGVPVGSQPFTTGSTPQTCVVQVWMYQ